MEHANCERCGWNVEYQTWDGYCIAIALDILQARPRPSVRLQPKDLVLSSIRDSIKGTETHVAHVDARRPCIAIPRGKRFLVIDGNHRAAKSLRARASVRAYILTGPEAKRARSGGE